MDAYGEVISALEAMMAVDRSDREPYYQAAAESIVRMRHAYGGVKNQDYRAAIQQAYREAGVPTDSEDTVLAALRYHISKAKTAPQAKQSSEPSRRPRRTSEAPEVTPMPSILADALGDPVGLVVHAIRSIEAAKNLKPPGPEGDTIRFLLKSLWAEVDALAELVDQNNDGAG